MDTLAQLQAVDQETLTPFVRQALGSDAATPTDWQVAAFGNGAYDCVYRFAGHAQTHEGTAPWSLVVKVASADGREDPAGVRYWQREALAYGSGLLADLPAGLSAPRCFGVMDQPHEECWLWMEEVAGGPAGPWSLEQCVRVARGLGMFGATYLVSRPLPEYSWLSRDWQRSNTKRAAEAAAQLPAMLDHPFVRPALPDDMPARLFRFWEEREALCDAIGTLPQTFCHLDINYRNLLVRRDRESEGPCVAVDWEYAGINAIGAELATIIGTPLLFRKIDVPAATVMESAALAAYQEGLRDAGWHGGADEPRAGYALGLALHLVPLLMFIVHMGATSADFRAGGEQATGISFLKFLEGSAVFLDFMLSRSDEARQTLGFV